MMKVASRPRRPGKKVASDCLRSGVVVEAVERRLLLSADVTWHVVAAAGAGVPGVAGPATYSGEITSAVVNDAGQVAFTAHFAGPGITPDNDSAVFAGPADAPAVVVREGDAVPGTGGSVVCDDATFVRPVLLDDAGRVAFVAQVRGPDVTQENQKVLVGGDAASPQVLARSHGPAPGGGAGYSYGGTFNSLRLTDDGRLWFDSAANEPERDGGYAIFSAKLGLEPVQRVAAVGDVAPGAPGLPELKYVYTGPRINAVGPADRLLVGAAVRGTDGSDPFPRGLMYTGTRADLDPVVGLVEGRPVPGLDPSQKFQFFLDPVTINAAGVAVLNAYVGPDMFEGAHPALLRIGPDGSVSRLIGWGDPGPVPGTTLDHVGGATIDTAGNVTFVGRYAGSGTAESVIFTGQPGAFREVVRVGQQAPGAPQGVTIASILVPAANDAGRIAFQASLSGPGVDASNNKALFASDAAGALTMVARTGQAVDLGGGRARQVRDITWNAGDPFGIGMTNGTDGKPSPFNDAGQLVFHVATEDGSAIVMAGVNAPPPARVVARHVFYNRSAFDEIDAGANAADDSAIATDKNALLAGADRLPGFDNVTSYDRGINGVMIDIADLPIIDALLDARDFDFGSAGTPVSVTVRAGAGEGGSDRVTLIWRDYNPADASPLPQAVGNGWLTVTMKANYHTGLAAPDVFSFGNLIGETGDRGATPGWRVSALDLTTVKRALNTTAPITAATDFNRDGRTNALDLSTAKRNLNHALAMMPPAAAPARLAQRAGSLLDEG